jgi:heterodisulfide reductase subunit A-like polyferredoxin
MGFVKTDNPSVVSIATASFGVIGTVVGAYFGARASNESTQKAIASTSKAIDGMKDEAAKAQSFAAHLDPKQAADAIDQYQRLRDDKDTTG